MFEKILMTTVLTGALMSGAGFALAADQDQDRFKEKIYGSQFMTKEERAEYRKNILSAKTEMERGKIRARHRELMNTRTKEHGLAIPDDLPAKSGGMGSGMGMRGGSGGGRR